MSRDPVRDPVSGSARVDLAPLDPAWTLAVWSQRKRDWDPRIQPIVDEVLAYDEASVTQAAESLVAGILARELCVGQAGSQHGIAVTFAPDGSRRDWTGRETWTHSPEWLEARVAVEARGGATLCVLCTMLITRPADESRWDVHLQFAWWGSGEGQFEWRPQSTMETASWSRRYRRR